MTPIEEAQIALTTARETVIRLGLPCLMVIGIPSDGKVVSFGGGLSDPIQRALVAGAAMGILAKAQKETVVVKAPRGFKLPKDLPPTTPFPDQKPSTPQS